MIRHAQFVAANVIFAQSPLRGAYDRSNLTGELDKAAEYLARPFAPLGEMNLALVSSKVREHAKNNIRYDNYLDVDLDFDGDRHDKRRIGAYAFDKHKPRWLPILEIKPAKGLDEYSPEYSGLALDRITD